MPWSGSVSCHPVGHARRNGTAVCQFANPPTAPGVYSDAWDWVRYLNEEAQVRVRTRRSQEGQLGARCVISGGGAPDLGGLPRRAGELRGRQQIRPDRAGAAEDHDMGSRRVNIGKMLARLVR